MTENADNETTAPAANEKKTKKKAKKKAKEKAKKAKEQEEQAVIVLAIADALHAIIKEAAPRLTATMMWGHQFYTGTEPVVGVALHDDHVNLVVYNGDAVQDPEGLMKGVGYNRAVRVNSLEEIRTSALAEIVRTSAGADAAKKPAPSAT